MTKQNPLSTGRWAAFTLIGLLIAVHLILHRFFWHVAVPRIAVPNALMVGLLLLLVAKHVGLVTVLIRAVRSAVQKRSRS